METLSSSSSDNELRSTIDLAKGGNLSLSIFWGRPWKKEGRFEHQIVSLPDKKSVTRASVLTTEGVSRVILTLKAGKYEVIISKVTNNYILWIELQSGRFKFKNFCELFSWLPQNNFLKLKLILYNSTKKMILYRNTQFIYSN